MTKFVNIFAIPTTSQIEESLKKTSKTARKINKNFSEKEKQVVTPKQTKKTTPAQVSPIVDLKGVNDPKAQEFIKVWWSSYNSRAKEYMRINHLQAPRTEKEENEIGFYKDSSIMRKTMRMTPALVYNDMVALAGLLGMKNGHAFAMQYAHNVAILDKTNSYYVAQKEMNKFPETVHALALGRKCKIGYVVDFATAIVNGHRDHQSTKLQMYALNNKAKIDEKTKQEYAKQGAKNFTPDTASAQTDQCKKICMYLGLITYVKGKKNTPITVNSDRALELFKMISTNKQ